MLSEFIISCTTLCHSPSLRKCENTIEAREEEESTGGWGQSTSQDKQKDGKRSEWGEGSLSQIQVEQA